MSTSDSIRYVIYPNDRRDVHDITENRVAKFASADSASVAASGLNDGTFIPDSIVWEDYK